MKCKQKSFKISRGNETRITEKIRKAWNKVRCFPTLKGKNQGSGNWLMTNLGLIESVRSTQRRGGSMIRVAFAAIVVGHCLPSEPRYNRYNTLVTFPTPVNNRGQLGLIARLLMSHECGRCQGGGAGRAIAPGVGDPI